MTVISGYSSSYDSYSTLLNSISTTQDDDSTISTLSTSSSTSYSTSISDLVGASYTRSISTEDLSYLSGISRAAGSLKSSFSDLLERDSADADGMVSAMKDFIAAYNDLLSTANDSDNAGAAKLSSELKGIANTYSNALEKIGITIGSDGILSIDEDKLAESAADGSLNRFLETNTDGANFGFANKLNQLASGITNNASKYYTEEKETKLTSDELTLSDYSSNQLRTLVTYEGYSALLDASV